jgi:hypothetical protein
MRADTYNRFNNDDYKLNNESSSFDSANDKTKNTVQGEGDRSADRNTEKPGKIGDKELTHTVSDAASTIATGVTDAVHATTDKIEDGWKSVKGMYEGSSVSKVSDEFSTVVRRYPLQTFVGALAVGAWLGMKVYPRQSAHK